MPIVHLVLCNLQDEVSIGNHSSRAPRKHVQILHGSDSLLHVGITQVGNLEVLGGPTSHHRHHIHAHLGDGCLSSHRRPAFRSQRVVSPVVQRTLPALEYFVHEASASLVAAHQVVAQVSARSDTDELEASLPGHVLGVRLVPGDLFQHVPHGTDVDASVGGRQPEAALRFPVAVLTVEVEDVILDPHLFFGDGAIPQEDQGV
mmetsp:Transcript_110257/g.351436  ORF Transcript_110257/g.351436 Transcript_110257/m.351436 type:complete len:203 (-) Transcript_110257:193-801(-)